MLANGPDAMSAGLLWLSPLSSVVRTDSLSFVEMVLSLAER